MIVRQFKCLICGWKGKPYRWIGLPQAVRYDEALQHFKDEHPTEPFMKNIHILEIETEDSTR